MSESTEQDSTYDNQAGIDEPASDAESVELPVGTAYVTPLGEIGVVGYEVDSARPLEHADRAATLHFSGKVREEAMYH